MTFSAANLKLYAQTLASSFALVVLYIKTTFEETRKTLLLLHKHTTDIYSVFTLKINKQSRKDPVGSPRNAEVGERHTRTVFSWEYLHCCCECHICGGWWAEQHPGRSRWSPQWCRRCPGRGSFLPSRRWCSGSSACDHQSWALGNCNWYPGRICHWVELGLC